MEPLLTSLFTMPYRGRKRNARGQFIKAGFRASSYLPTLGRMAMGAASGYAGRFFSSGTNRRQMRSGQGVTFEHDKTGIYRRKRMPRKKRKRWVRKIRLNNAIDQIKLGTNTVLFNKSQAFGNSTAGDHGLTWAALYGGKSSNTVLSDLAKMATLDNNGDPTSAAGTSKYKSTKVFFKSAVLDMTIRNISSAGNETSTPADVPLEVDIYEMSSKRKFVENDSGTTLTQWNNIPELYSEALSETNVIGTTGTKVALTSRGATPWDNTFALSRYGLKIHKKTKYRIGRGNSITYQFRDPKNRTMSLGAMEEIAGCNKPGWTHHILIIFKSVPGFSVGTGENDIQERIQIGYTRKYTYKVEGATDDRSEYIANT